MKKIIYITAGVLLIAAFVVIKLVWYPSPSAAGGPAPAAGAKQPAMPVSGVVVRPERSDDILFSTGTVVPNESVALSAETSGRIVGLYFEDGSTVAAGKLLMKLDDKELLAQQAKLNIQLKLAGEREDRAKKLLAIGGTSQEDYDISLTEKLAIQAELDLLATQIAKTELRAPFSGTTGFRKVSSGSYATPASEIATLIQTDPVKIEFSVPEKYAGKILPGDTITCTISGNKAPFKAVVSAIDPTIDEATRTLKIRALARNPKGSIRPGSFARIEVSAGSNAASLQIPTQALIKEFKGQKVFLAKNGKAVPAPVEIARRTELKVEITSGIAPGDTVITTGIMSLKPGAPVKVNILNEPAK